MVNYILFILFSFSLLGMKLGDKEFDHLVKKLIKNSKAKLISVEELSKVLKSEDVILLDARERDEFETSHLKGAIHVGYDEFDLSSTIKKLDKLKKIVVYCSVGYRSAIISDKILKSGFRVENLYGGIFEWVNQGNKVFTLKLVPTALVHTYSKSWSKWLKKGKVRY